MNNRAFLRHAYDGSPDGGASPLVTSLFAAPGGPEEADALPGPPVDHSALQAPSESTLKRARVARRSRRISSADDDRRREAAQNASATPKDQSGRRRTRSDARASRPAPAHGRFKLLALDRLAPDPSNPRRHSREQIGAIARSIEAFGFTAPILVDGANRIVAGHGRYEAAKRLGLETIPVRRFPAKPVFPFQPTARAAPGSRQGLLRRPSGREITRQGEDDPLDYF